MIRALLKRSFFAALLLLISVEVESVHSSDHFLTGRDLVNMYDGDRSERNWALGFAYGAYWAYASRDIDENGQFDVACWYDPSLSRQEIGKKIINYIRNDTHAGGRRLELAVVTAGIELFCGE